jgi:NADPH:quinone reductase-like Zn-dependent oxidoreductase
MKAIVWTKYGSPDGLHLKEVEKPTPKDNEVLIKIHATTVTAGDCEMRSLKLAIWLRPLTRMIIGLFKPKRITILGQELAGEIEAVGKDVKRFKKDDQIFASTDFFMGAYAEYKCLPEDGMLALKPTNLTFEEAATLPVGGLNALHFIGKGNIQDGQKVLINGAGGSIGTIAIQLAKLSDAVVTAIDSESKFEMMKSIGADKVIDYKQEDFTKSGEKYDIIFDIVGKASFSRSIRSLTKNGIYLLGNPSLMKNFRGRWISRLSSKKVISEVLSGKIEDLIHLKELFEAGKLKTVIDKSYPLEQIAEAHKYVEAGGKKGNVVIKVR